MSPKRLLGTAAAIAMTAGCWSRRQPWLQPVQSVPHPLCELRVPV